MATHNKKEKDKKNDKPASPVMENFMFDEVTFYTTSIPTKMKMRKPFQPVDMNKITAFIPGTIEDIFVKKGDHVEKGDRLLILYAMKMNNVLVAPASGEIKDVFFQKGDRVTKNAILVDIHPDECPDDN